MGEKEAGMKSSVTSGGGELSPKRRKNEGGGGGKHLLDTATKTFGKGDNLDSKPKKQTPKGG